MTTQKSALAVFVEMIQWGPEADLALTHHGAQNPEGDWPPVVRMTGDNGTIEVLLTAKNAGRKDGRSFVFGLVDFGHGNPEVGPIDLQNFIADADTDPKPMLAIDRSFQFDPNGKTIYQILAEKRAKLAQK